jgi:hypothetical protein
MEGTCNFIVLVGEKNGLALAGKWLVSECMIVFKCKVNTFSVISW